MHSSSVPFDAAKLSTRVTYKAFKGPTTLGAWSRFHDRQLNRLICVALLDSPTMASAEARVRQSEYLATGAASALWPTVDFSGYIQRQRFSERGLAPPPFNGQTFNIATLGLNFNYEFDFWGKNRQAYKAAVGEQYAAQADANQASLILAAAVANTYFQLLGAVEQAKIAEQNWQLNKRLLHIVMERSKKGVESKIPVKTIEGNLQAAKLVLEQVRENEALARHQLAALLGKNPCITDIGTHSFVFQRHRVLVPHFLPANLLAKRPDVHAAKCRAEAAAHRVNVAKARFFPDINLSALFGYQNVGLVQIFKEENQNNAVTAAVDLPIFDAGARRANLGVKFAEYDLAVNDYNQTILTALREVADQLATLKSLNSRINAQDLAVKASEQQYKLYHSRYDHGIADMLQLLENKQLLLQQQAILVDLQARHYQATVTLLKALGGNDNIYQGVS